MGEDDGTIGGTKRARAREGRVVFGGRRNLRVSLSRRAVSPAVRAFGTPGFFLPSASFRSPSLSYPRAACVCVCVYVGDGANLCLVWQRRFRRHDDEPRKPSRSLTPLFGSLAVLFPFALLSLSLLPLAYLYVCLALSSSVCTSTILSGPFAETFYPMLGSRFSLSLSLSCRSAATPIPAVRLRLLRVLLRARVRARLCHPRVRRVRMYARFCRLPPGSSTSSVLSLAAAHRHPAVRLRGWRPCNARSLCRREPKVFRKRRGGLDDYEHGEIGSTAPEDVSFRGGDSSLSP